MRSYVFTYDDLISLLQRTYRKYGLEWRDISYDDIVQYASLAHSIIGSLLAVVYPEFYTRSVYIPQSGTPIDGKFFYDVSLVLESGVQARRVFPSEWQSVTQEGINPFNRISAATQYSPIFTIWGGYVLHDLLSFAGNPANTSTGVSTPIPPNIVYETQCVVYYYPSTIGAWLTYIEIPSGIVPWNSSFVLPIPSTSPVSVWDVYVELVLYLSLLPHDPQVAVQKFAPVWDSFIRAVNSVTQTPVLHHPHLEHVGTQQQTIRGTENDKNR